MGHEIEEQLPKLLEGYRLAIESARDKPWPHCDRIRDKIQKEVRDVLERFKLLHETFYSRLYTNTYSTWKKNTFFWNVKEPYYSKHVFYTPLAILDVLYDPKRDITPMLSSLRFRPVVGYEPWNWNFFRSAENIPESIDQDILYVRNEAQIEDDILLNKFGVDAEMGEERRSRWRKFIEKAKDERNHQIDEDVRDYLTGDIHFHRTVYDMDLEEINPQWSYLQERRRPYDGRFMNRFRRGRLSRLPSSDDEEL